MNSMALSSSKCLWLYVFRRSCSSGKQQKSIELSDVTRVTLQKSGYERLKRWVFRRLQHSCNKLRHCVNR